MPVAATGPMPQVGDPAQYGSHVLPADGPAAGWNYGQPPWDGGAPEPDPRLRYREPGPGMPGYRGTPEQYWDEQPGQYWSGPLEQHWGDNR